jgi:hypothetical protein
LLLVSLWPIFVGTWMGSVLPQLTPSPHAISFGPFDILHVLGANQKPKFDPGNWAKLWLQTIWLPFKNLEGSPTKIWRQDTGRLPLSIKVLYHVEWREEHLELLCNPNGWLIIGIYWFVFFCLGQVNEKKCVLLVCFR